MSNEKTIEKTSAPSPPSRGHFPRVGQFDRLEVAVGYRGKGKSTYLCDRAADTVIDANGGAYVIGHSLGARLPVELPDGTKLPIRYYRSIHDLERGLQDHPTDWHIVAGGDADPVIHFARALSAALRERAWYAAGNMTRFDPMTTKMDGIECPLVVVIVDEGAALRAAAGKAQRKEDDEWFNDWIFSLRHEHTVLFYSIQNSNARSWLLMDQATRIVAFKVKHRWALNSLEAAGADSEQIELIRRLPKYQHETIYVSEDDPDDVREPDNV